MAPEIVRKLVGGKWRTVEENPGGGGGAQPVWEAVTVPTDAASWTALDAPATVLADTAPTLPLTVDGSNDTFVYTSNGGSPETFTLAHAVYATLTPLIAAMASATGSVSGERFDTIIIPSNSSGKILLTTPTSNGLGNDATITEGNRGAAALGFTGNPDTFANGYGGSFTVNNGLFTYNQLVGLSDVVICTNTDEWGQAWAVECEISLANVVIAGSAFNAGAPLYNAPAGQELNGSGFEVTGGNYPPIVLTTDLYQENQPTANLDGVNDPTFHTYRIINTPLVQLAYLDGVLVGQSNIAPNAFDVRNNTSRFLLYSSADGDQFRNLKAWRLPLPTLP